MSAQRGAHAAKMKRQIVRAALTAKYSEICIIMNSAAKTAVLEPMENLTLSNKLGNFGNAINEVFGKDAS